MTGIQSLILAGMLLLIVLSVNEYWKPELDAIL